MVRTMFSSRGFRRLMVPVAFLVAFGIAVPASAFVVILKDGRQIQTKELPKQEGDQVVLIMPSGTRTSLPVSEVDLPKTEEANKKNQLDATVLREEAPPPPPPSASEDPSLSQVLASRGRGLSLPEPRRRDVNMKEEIPMTPAGFVDFMTLRRAAYLDGEVTSELLRYLKGQGLDQVKLFQGTEPSHPFLEIVANSEASVFKTLKDCANALVQLNERFPQKVTGLEILMVTDAQIRSGQFVLTPELASELASGAMEAPLFFLRHVQF